MNAIRDDFNPKFVTFTAVSGEDLAAKIDEAIRAYSGDTFEPDGDAVIERLNPAVAPGTMRIDLWVENLDDASCTYGFLCSSANGATAYARGERTVKKAGAPQRERRLLRDLHAFA
jgi:hypothetical protein